MNTIKPYVKNCFIEPKEDQKDVVFHGEGDNIHPHLDGYAIIPLKKYIDLLSAAGLEKETAYLVNSLGG